jgi:hypothetical protein
MANALYAKGRQGFLGGLIDWDTAVIQTSLTRGYSPSISTHVFVSDVIAAGGILEVTATLTGKTIIDGIADADNVLFPAIPSGPACNRLIIYQASAPSGGVILATSQQRLICLIDTAPGLPYTPNGSTLTVQWSNTTNRIFKL